MSSRPPEPESLTAALKRIAVMTVVVGGLGFALHAGIAIAAGSPGAPFAIAVMLATPLAVLCGWQVYDGWRKGAIAVWRDSIARADRPGAYWFNMIWYGACALALATLSLWSGWRMVALTPVP